LTFIIFVLKGTANYICYGNTVHTKNLIDLPFLSHSPYKTDRPN